MRQLAFGRTLCGVLLISCSFASINGQTAQTTKKTVPASDSPAVSSAVEKPSEAKTVAAMTKADRLFYLRNFVDRAQSTNTTTGVDVMIGIASVAWKYDQQFARDTFSKALGIIDDKRRSFSDDSDYKDSPWPGLRMRIAKTLARYDADWSRRLFDEYKDSTRSTVDTWNRGQAYYDIALDFLNDDPARAAEYGAQSIKAGAPRYFVGFLYTLKEKDPAAADRLFLQALDALASDPEITAEDFALYGTYIFTSVGLPDPRITNRFLPMRIGIQEVIDLRIDRSDASRDLIVAYIQTAIRLFSRQPSDLLQARQYYIYSRMLLPRAQRLSPELAASLNQVILGLAANMPNEITDNSEFQKPALQFLPSEKDAEEAPNTKAHDYFYGMLVRNAVDRSDFANAKKLAEKIGNVDIRTNVNLVIDAGIADTAIQHHELKAAEDIVSHMPDCLAAAMLRLALSEAEIKNGDKKKAIENVNAALTMTYKLNRPTVPYLMLKAAAIQTQVDPDVAEITLSQAVKRFNSDELESPYVDFYMEVNDGDQRDQFKIKMRSTEFGFSQSLSPLMNLNPQNTIQNVLLLERETTLGKAMIGLAAVIAKGSETTGTKS